MKFFFESDVEERDAAPGGAPKRVIMCISFT
jgi:hypothetical protein